MNRSRQHWHNVIDPVWMVQLVL